MIESIQRYLALVTVCMPLALGFAHTVLSIATAAHARSKRTASKADDAVTQRLLIFATWLDLVARSIAHAASLGFFLRDESLDRTPAIERVEGDES